MDIKNLGFDNWVELYEYLKEKDLHEAQRIGLYWPDGFKPEPSIIEEGDGDRAEVEDNMVVLDLDWIKANAFSELFPALPLKSSIAVLTDVVESLTHLAGKKNTEPVLEFLNKIPTRRS